LNAFNGTEVMLLVEGVLFSLNPNPWKSKFPMKFFFLQALIFFLATLNTRFIAKCSYVGVVTTDVALVITTFMFGQVHCHHR